MVTLESHIIGEIKLGDDIGYNNHGHHYIWAACEICGKERWVVYYKGNIVNKRCHKCSLVGRKIDQETKRKRDEIIEKYSIGDTEYGLKLGYRTNCKYIVVSCELCHGKRWVSCHRIVTNRCKGCSNIGRKATPETKNLMSIRFKGRKFSLETRHRLSATRKGKYTGAESHMWKGGRRKHTHGYIMQRLYSDDKYYDMVGKAGCVPEHRLVMARYLGRSLEQWEIVHHKNGIKDDNRIENLKLIGNNGEHNTQIEQVMRNKDKKIEMQSIEIFKLKKEISILKCENEEFDIQPIV